MDSEAVVSLSKVAPPADSLSASLPTTTTQPDEAGALLLILHLAASLTASLGPLVLDSERALVYQNISLASQLAQVRFNTDNSIYFLPSNNIEYAIYQ